MSTLTIELQASLRKASISRARKLIEAGKIVDSGDWNAPSPKAEDAYIEERGFLEYSDFFLGIDTEAEPDTKGRFKYPFSSDFKSISRPGLNAIRSYAARFKEDDIFDAAGRLLDMIDKKREASSPRDNATRLTFQMQGGTVDRAGGTIKGISVIEQGEARGHRMMISGRTLGAVEQLVEDKVLPAYISHNGAQADRLMEEVGAFSNFYRDGEKIRAGLFEALPSFREHEPERFDRLFDLAESMPSTFGISIVFEGALFWETDEEDVPFEGFAEQPEGSSFDLPTIEPTRIFSADFVDTPAATVSLFAEQSESELNDSRLVEDMKSSKTELDESASAALERIRAAEAEEAKPTPEPAEEVKKKAKSKKKEALEEGDEALAEEPGYPPDCNPGFVEVDGKCVAEPESVDADDEEEEEMQEQTVEAAGFDAAPELLELTLQEYKNRINERDVLIADQTERMDELLLENRVFRRALAGTEAIALEGNADTAPGDVKKEAIESYLKDNPTHNRVTAVLAVAKKQPEIFNN